MKQITIPKVQSGMFLEPGEKISSDFLAKLAVINAHYTKKKDFPKYQQDLGKLFDLSPDLRSPKITSRTTDYLAGFIEGEGSLSVGAKKNATSKLKVYIDPEFNVTQHINGIANLYLVLTYFKTGRLRHKTGSNATFVFTIDNRLTLEQKIVPFYENYLSSYFGTPIKKRRVWIFKTLLRLFNEKAHLDLERMLFEILPLWNAMRIQVGQENETFKSLADAQDYVRMSAASHANEVDEVERSSELRAS
jgi:hypothetical protein